MVSPTRRTRSEQVHREFERWPATDPSQPSPFARPLWIEGVKAGRGRVGSARLHPRLLIVHPNPYSADVLATILAPLRLECHHAAGHWAAVRWLADHPSPALVAVDPTAPDRLGLIAFTLRQQPDYPVLALFTSPHERAEVEALRLGAAAVLGYPCPPEEIRAAVAGALLMNRTPASGGRPPATADAAPDGPPRPAPAPEPGAVVTPLRQNLEEFERRQIERALHVLGWNRGETARALGIERTTLYHKMRKYGLLAPSDPA